MILKFSLLLALGALAGFLFTIAFYQLGLPGLAGYAAQFGSISLLVAFVILLTAGIALLVKWVAVSCCHYFSEHQRLSRRLCFYVNRHEQISRLFRFKKRRLLYITQQKHKALSERFMKDAVNPEANGDLPKSS